MADSSIAPSQWLACVATLPTEEPASRMRLLRMLDSLGCAVMREGVYLLPDTPANRQSLARLCEHIARAGGFATTLHVAAADQKQAQHFQQQFDRSAKYEALIATILSLRTGFGVSDPAAIAKVLAKQRRELDAIAMLDFFPSAIRDKAIKTLAEAEAEVRALMFPGRTAAGAAGPEQPYVRRTWATRTPLWADRLACAWLIRRFIDAEARLLWLDKSQPVPQSALAFGFEGARFCNSHTQITFEQLLGAFALDKNPPLRKMAVLVHYLEAGGTPIAEAAGVETLLQGARRRALSEDELFAESEKTFDLLYDAYCETATT